MGPGLIHVHVLAEFNNIFYHQLPIAQEEKKENHLSLQVAMIVSTNYRYNIIIKRVKYKK